MSDMPPPAQAFELGMHAAIKAAGIKKASEADAFFKIANQYLVAQETQVSRKEAFEVAVRGTLSNAGIKSSAEQDEAIKVATTKTSASDLRERLKGLLGGAQAAGGAAVEKAKPVVTAAGSMAQQAGAKARTLGGTLAEKVKAPAIGMKDMIKKKLRSLGIQV